MIPCRVAYHMNIYSLVVRWDLTVGIRSNDHLTRLLVTFFADL